MISSRALVVFAGGAIVACSSFSGQSVEPGGGGADAATPDGGGVVVGPDGSPPTDDGGTPASCTTLEQTFDGVWPDPAWPIIQNPGAYASLGSGWDKKALAVSFGVQAQGTTRAQVYHSFASTRADCDLDISFDARLHPTTDAARWILLQVRGSAGGVVQLDHSGSFWYLRMGNTQSQIAVPSNGVVGRMRLVIRKVGAHAEATYTLDGGSPAPAADVSTTVGDGADVLFGSEVQGQLTSAASAELDNVRVAW